MSIGLHGECTHGGWIRDLIGVRYDTGRFPYGDHEDFSIGERCDRHEHLPCRYFLANRVHRPLQGQAPKLLLTQEQSPLLLGQLAFFLRLPLLTLIGIAHVLIVD